MPRFPLKKMPTPLDPPFIATELAARRGAKSHQGDPTPYYRTEFENSSNADTLSVYNLHSTSLQATNEETLYLVDLPR